jgi:hypothetical protein
MRYVLPLAFCLSWAITIQAQFDLPVLDGMTGTALLEELRLQYRPTAVLPYDDARDILFGQIDKQEDDSLECIYTGHKVYLPPSQDPTTAAYQNGSNDGINTEHTYPQGLWIGGNTPKSDMHHLFPTRAIVNNDRSNDPFADINDNFTEKWYYRNLTYTSIPGGDLDKYSEAVNGYFEPRESVKGDIARAMMYFYAMYPAEANAENPNYFASQTATLCEWHDADPVDWKEWNRTWAIADWQQGKPNPFVLDCTLAARGYCGGTVGPNCQFTSVEESGNETPGIDITPNPAQTDILVNADWETPEGIHIRLYDLRGQLLHQTQSNSLQGLRIPLEHLPKGLLLLKLEGEYNGRFQRVSTKIIHLGN